MENESGKPRQKINEVTKYDLEQRSVYNKLKDICSILIFFIYLLKKLR